jgi:hypothetical protein
MIPFTVRRDLRIPRTQTPSAMKTQMFMEDTLFEIILNKVLTWKKQANKLMDRA